VPLFLTAEILVGAYYGQSLEQPRVVWLSCALTCSVLMLCHVLYYLAQINGD